MLAAYRRQAEERSAKGIPPLPLNAAQTRDLCALLEQPPAGEDAGALVALLRDRVPPGVDEAAEVKVAFLAAVVAGQRRSPLIAPAEAVRLLGAMPGGFNVPVLAGLLDGAHAAAAADALARLVLIGDTCDAVKALADRGVAAAKSLLERWADREWLTARPALAESLALTVYRVPGETNTDDLSPAGHASTRPDIPLHALAMYERRDPACVPFLTARRAAGERVLVAGDVYGTGSSRKSATNSLLWWIGDDIPGVPNKRRGGVLMAKIIAPIFLTTLRDTGSLPIAADVSALESGERIVLKPFAGIIERQGKAPLRFEPVSAALAEEYRAGGRLNLIIGNALTERAAAALGRAAAVAGATADTATGGYTLAQKLVGQACGRNGVRPGESVNPRMQTVGSQDTTGPMTADELKELACVRFAAPLVMQSFCHTAAYPKAVDAKMHGWLPTFISSRGGVALRPGDGVIHSWLNRLLLPDGVGTGGDSHTRFPLGISFPAGSGLVAFAAAFGFMPLDMPESVLVRFTGTRRADLTLRDLVNAIPWAALQAGDLSADPKAKKNPFAGRILEMEGLDDLTPEQAFELTDASAERSAAASTIALSVERTAEFVRTNAALIRSLLEAGYQDAEALRRRLAAMEAWLARPTLQHRDADAAFAKTYVIDQGALTEPLLCLPNDPDKIGTLSQVAGTPVDEVFIGSCMISVGNVRAAAKLLGAADYVKTATWICPPTRFEADALRAEGVYATLGERGCRLEIPGCSLCMGNQARVRPGAVVFSTSTRNFDNRMGRDAQVYLGSAELAAITAILGRIPTLAEYRQAMTALTPDLYRCWAGPQG